MKKIALILVFVFACLASALAQKIDFQEGGVSFTLSVYGTLTYNLPAGKQVLNDASGKPIRIGDITILYGYDGKPSRVGSIMIVYGYNKKVSHIGGMQVLYDYNGNVSQTIGAVGGSSAANSGGGSTQTNSQTTTPTYVSDVIFENTEKLESLGGKTIDEYNKEAEKNRISRYIEEKSELEKKYNKLDKNVAIPNGMHEVKVDDGEYIQTKYAYVYEGRITYVVYKNMLENVSNIGSIQQGKSYYKRFTFDMDYFDRRVKQTYQSTNINTVYFINYLESKKVSSYVSSFIRLFMNFDYIFVVNLLILFQIVLVFA